MSNLWSLGRQSANDWIADRASSMAAAIAFYTMFSLAPLLLISIAIAGLVFGEEAARSAIVTQVGQLVGKTGAEGIQTVLEAARNPEGGGVAAIVSVVTLIIGATTVFAELQTDLDVVNAAVTALGAWWGAWFGHWDVALQVVNLLVSFLVVTGLFAMIYKILPSLKIAWSDVWIGAIATAVLLTIGKFLIGLYIGRSAMASDFGAAGTFVVVIVWIYYAGLVFLFGAEFTHAYARTHGSIAGDAGRQPALQPAQG